MFTGTAPSHSWRHYVVCFFTMVSLVFVSLVTIPSAHAGNTIVAGEFSYQDITWTANGLTGEVTITNPASNPTEVYAHAWYNDVAGVIQPGETRVFRGTVFVTDFTKPIDVWYGADSAKVAKGWGYCDVCTVRNYEQLWNPHVWPYATSTTVKVTKKPTRHSRGSAVVIVRIPIDFGTPGSGIVVLKKGKTVKQFKVNLRRTTPSGFSNSPNRIKLPKLNKGIWHLQVQYMAKPISETGGLPVYKPSASKWAKFKVK